MFTLFRRKTASPAKVPTPDAPKGLLLPESPEGLLATSRRQKLLEHIWQRTSLSHAQFRLLYIGPLERYAALVQQFPASEAHHHAYAGGMLDHGLEIVAYALKLRQSHLLPVGAPPETQAAQAEVWTAGAAYAALLHDVGKIAVDLHVEYADGTRWFPWHGHLAQPYRFRYRTDRAYRLHNAAAGLLYTDILDKPILDWLSGFPELWSSLLYVLAGQYEHAGILGDLVTQADQASVAQDLGGDPAKALLVPRQGLQRKLLDGLRYLLKEQLRLNQPQASDGWLTQDALWLVSKTVCDKLRAYLLSQGIEGIPSSNTAVFNVLQEHSLVQATPDGKAIWKAVVASDSGWTHEFTFLKLSPALIWDARERPAAFAGSIRVDESLVTNTMETVETPTSPPMRAATETSPIRTAAPPMQSSDSIGDVLALLSDTASDDAPTPQEDESAKASHVATQPVGTDSQSGAVPKPPLASEDALDAPLGSQFISWLRSRIETRRLKINDAQALVHTVDGTAFLVTPGIFQRFTQENPNVAIAPRDKKIDDWAWVQRNFEKLRLHKKQDNGLNIFMCEVAGPRKKRRLYGYLLLDGCTLFPTLPFDNPYLKVLIPASPSKIDAA